MRYIRFFALLAALLLAGAVAAQGAQQEQEMPTIHVGMQATGTFSWVIYAMQHYGFPQKYGFKLDAKTLASKSAARLALRGGTVGIVVDDFIGAQVMANNGVPVHVIYPYSKDTGGVVVRADGDIKTIADLKGKKIAASALNDKSLLILRALAIAKYNFDPQDASHLLAAAPPLMASLLDKGDIDAAIPYWHFVARMVASGKYSELISDVDMLKQLGMNTNLPLLVVVGRTGLNPTAAEDFVKALVATTNKMKTDDAIWQDILDKGLYSLPNPSLFPAVRALWEKGLPTEWNQSDVEALVKLTDRLVAVAGADVVGVSKVDPKVYDTEFQP